MRSGCSNHWAIDGSVVVVHLAARGGAPASPDHRVSVAVPVGVGPADDLEVGAVAADPQVDAGVGTASDASIAME